MAKKKYGRRFKRRDVIPTVFEHDDAQRIRAMAEREGVSVGEKIRRMLDFQLEQARLHPELAEREAEAYPLRSYRVRANSVRVEEAVRVADELVRGAEIASRFRAR